MFEQTTFIELIYSYSFYATEIVSVPNYNKKKSFFYLVNA